MSFSEAKKVPKGWGHELWVVNKPEYCGKLLFFERGKRCSWHYHEIKDETFYMQSGKIFLSYSTGDDLNIASRAVLNKGDSFWVKPGLRHQIYALEDTELYEFSTQHFDSDSYRIVKGN